MFEIFYGGWTPSSKKMALSPFDSPFDPHKKFQTKNFPGQGGTSNGIRF